MASIPVWWRTRLNTPMALRSRESIRRKQQWPCNVRSVLRSCHSHLSWSLDGPRVTTTTSTIATDIFTSEISLSCEIDSFPESKIFWKVHDQVIVPSTKYSIVQNTSNSQLIIKQISSNADYGLYSCHASNKLGDQSITIQLRSKGIVDIHFGTRAEIERTATAFALCSIIIISDFRQSTPDLPMCAGGSFCMSIV